MLSAVYCSAVTKARSLHAEIKIQNQIKFVPKEPKPKFHCSTVSFRERETNSKERRDKREA
jgi:hypothetical protein